jgi:hypothetical protein
MRISLLITVLGITLLSGCTSISKLTPKGALVRIVKKLPKDNVNGFTKVGTVACRSEIFLVTKTTNRQVCEDRLRNAGAALKAEYIIIDEVKGLPGFLSTGFDMYGTAYKKNDLLAK